MLAFRAHASSLHYVVSLVIHADSESEAVRMLEDYADVELVGRARLDLLLAAYDLTDEELPDPDDFIYAPFYGLTPTEALAGCGAGVALDTVDRIDGTAHTEDDDDPE